MAERHRSRAERSAGSARQTRLLRTLLDVSQRLASLNDLDEAVQTLADATHQATGARFVLVLRPQPDVDRLSIVAASGFTDEELQRVNRIPVTPRRFGLLHAVLQGEPIVLSTPIPADAFPEALVRGFGLSAVASAPIVVGGRLWGLIGLGVRPDDPFTVQAGAELLTGLATVAANAIGRTEAVAALEQQSHDLEATVADRTAQLREAVDDLRVASQARTEFLATVSHELRTPLTAITGFAEVLSTGLDGPLTDEQLEDIRAIERASGRLLELIDDLIGVGRIGAGRLALAPENVDVEAVIGAAVEEIRPRAEARSIEVFVAPVPQLKIVADRLRLGQILDHLLGNAVKFTPPEGTVRVETTTETSDAGAVVRIDVVDTGIGIGEEDQGLIFDKFHRAAGPAYEGTGLGLAIARELARLHGGSLTVSSVLGVGSRFSLRLPVAGPEAVVTQAGPANGSTGG